MIKRTVLNSVCKEREETGRAKWGRCNPGVSRKYKVTCAESQRAAAR